MRALTRMHLALPYTTLHYPTLDLAVRCHHGTPPHHICRTFIPFYTILYHFIPFYTHMYPIQLRLVGHGSCGALNLWVAMRRRSFGNGNWGGRCQEAADRTLFATFKSMDWFKVKSTGNHRFSSWNVVVSCHWLPKHPSIEDGTFFSVVNFMGFPTIPIQ